MVYDTPNEGNDDDDIVTKEEVGVQRKEEAVGSVDSHRRSGRRFPDSQNAISRDGEQLKIGDFTLFVDTDDNFTIRGTAFRGTEGLWELLKRKNVNMAIVNKANLKTYKNILILTNAHLNRYQPGDNINISLGKKFRDVIVALFANSKVRDVKSALRRKCIKY